MRILLTFLYAFCTAISIGGQTLKFEELLRDKISIRAIELHNDKVYYVGTDSKFGYASLINTADAKQTFLSEKKLQFRALAQDREFFYTISIESPAQFFKISKSTWEIQNIFSDSDKNAFYDALIYHKENFYTFSDPNPDLHLKFLKFSTFQDKFEKKWLSGPNLHTGEAAFAASNTNIAAYRDQIWFATGGKSSRIFRWNQAQDRFEIFSTPFIQGTESQGIYSIDFYSRKLGVAVGGDYTKQDANINNIATTRDGGKTWRIQASGKNGGYKTCVKFRPKSGGREMIAVGDQNVEYSKDYGRTWTKISDEKNLYVVQWVDKNTLVFAGKDRILKAQLIQ